MSNEEKTYSAELKTKVAKEAIGLGKKNLDQLSYKYGIPVSTILTWTVQYEKDPEAFQESVEPPKVSEASEGSGMDIDVEVSDETIAESMSYGVMPDNLNIRRMMFWSVLGVVLVLVFIIALQEMFNVSRTMAGEAAAQSTEFYRINQLNQEANETLNSFGVVDLENGVYRIPIDSAIDEMVESQ